MNLTKDDLVKLLTAMRDNSRFVHKEFHKDRKWSMSKMFLGESSAYDSVIMILTKPEFADKMWDIFCSGEEAAS